MIDVERKHIREREKEKTRRRMRREIDPENYEYIPEVKPADYYDNEINQRVAIYVRVSTDDVRQTTSFELQKKYYEDFVLKHPNWTLVNIYADEGISGTSIERREAFNQMIADCNNGKIDLIITKSVSRFARNVVNCIGTVRDLAALKPPVGVFFESECIFSLNDESQMALTFQASMAEEESHTRSRSMETSLRMRLDNGIPLTPKLLGYTHDVDGNLVINPEEAPTVKLAFFMYLYGYSTRQIAETFNRLGKRSYFGNINWSANGVVHILRNERHCGDVLTRKTFTPDYHTHKSVKNRGERPQSRYKNHHQAIVKRDDFIAVQRMLDNAKYKNNSFLPELKVIDSGLLTGFVTINPRWASFMDSDYFDASQSVYNENANDIIDGISPSEVNITVEAGDFDLRDFEIARSELFNNAGHPYMTFTNKKIKLNAACVKKLGKKNLVELLVNPITQKFAVRTTHEANRQGVICSVYKNKEYQPKEITCTAFGDTLFSLFGWNTDCKYRVTGTIYEQDGQIAYIFDIKNAETFLMPYMIANEGTQPLQPYKNRIYAVPEKWVRTFGKQYYLHEQTLSELAIQSKDDWKIRFEGQLFETGKKLNVTDYEEIKSYIESELIGLEFTEEY